MTMQLRKASREKAKLRIGLAGPSGSGKTHSALLLAFGITNDWKKVAIIDTENGSADLYSHLGDYQVLTLEAPFSPERYVEAIKACEDADMEVIIIDSITHEWNGKGGCLEINDEIASKMRLPNSFTAWAKTTPRHDAFIQAILQSKAHVITTVRSKTEYVLTSKDGKNVPTKAGMGQVTRDGFEYELTVSFDLNQDHNAFCSKDRTTLFMDKPPIVISQETGKTLFTWSQDETPSNIEQTKEIKKLCKILEKNEEKILGYYHVTKFEELSYARACDCLNLLNKQFNGKADQDTLMRINSAFISLDKNNENYLKSKGLPPIDELSYKQALEVESELEKLLIQKAKTSKKEKVESQGKAFIKEMKEESIESDFAEFVEATRTDDDIKEEIL